MTTLCLVLGDQLSHDLASLKAIDAKRDVVLMCEAMEECTYVRHHKKKIAFILSAMRHFARELSAKGYKVDYRRLDEPDNGGSFTEEVRGAIDRHDIDRLIVTFPGEYRVLQAMQSWSEAFGIPVEILEDDRFLCSPSDFATWAEGRKAWRMEFFYREMRRRHGILMQGEDPEGGQWNFDKDNRKPPDNAPKIPPTYLARTDAITEEVMALVAETFPDHFGDLEPFHLAVTRDQALYALDKFMAERLPTFGDYQDAMVQGEPWMFHSHLSFYINAGLLDPMECIRRAENAWYAGDAPLNAVEGFIRQILGWREYVRGVYWTLMPDYKKLNMLDADRPLPDFFWDGDTMMNCLRQCITETRQNAYAHHIQRLMLIGNFALLAGLSPDEVNEWYLIVYADAYEWVELPNVTGMILFADGGQLGSKPYAASGAYINRMSDYCRNCSYSVTKKNGPKACPFNYLYWDFLSRNRQRLGNNHRLGMVYKTLDRMSAEKRSAIRDDTNRFMKAIDTQSERRSD